MLEDNMSFSVKDAKVLYYAKKYRTDELVQKIFTSYDDNEMEDSPKKEKIGRYSAAVAIRNIKRINIKAVGTAYSKRTFEIVEKIKKAMNDDSLSGEEKRKKISKYCLAIALRRGAINVKKS
jgi:hypothetical protein